MQKSGRVHPKSNTPCRDDRRQAFHFGQSLFSKSFQRCCRVDPLQRSRASAGYRQTVRIFNLSKLFGMRKCVVTSSTATSNLSRS